MATLGTAIYIFGVACFQFKDGRGQPVWAARLAWPVLAVYFYWKWALGQAKWKR